MSRSVLYRPEAVDDIQAAHDWYEVKRSSLGQEFRAALTDVEHLLAQTAEAFPAVAPNLRRILLLRFPDSVYFAIGPE